MNYTVNGKTQNQTQWCKDMNVDESHLSKLRKAHPEIDIGEYIAGVLSGRIKVRKYTKKNKEKETTDDSARSKYYTVGGIRKSEADWSRDIGKYSDYLGALRRRHPEVDIEGVIAKELLNIRAHEANNEEEHNEELRVAANKKVPIRRRTTVDLNDVKTFNEVVRYGLIAYNIIEEIKRENMEE